MMVCLVAALLTAAVTTVQPVFDVKELARYRLTISVFTQFERATRLIADATRDEPRFAEQPLFNREISVAGDAREMAAVLEARLRTDPLLAGALRTAGMTPREYTTFALSLVAAHLAHGFVSAGVLARVPAGAAADNIKFIDEHAAQVMAVVKAIEAMSGS